MNHLGLSTRYEPPSDAGEFSGYAVIWGQRNGHNEVVQRGAFARSLAVHQRAGTKPLMLWAHDPSEIIGVWSEIREDDTGLFVRGNLILDIDEGRKAHVRLKAGAVNGLSIGFRVSPGGEKRGAGGVRLLSAIDIAEISIVGLPSASGARITDIRSSGRLNESAAAFVKACREATRSLQPRK
ncbi:HK97 family phage prohead protease [Ensifer sp. PDNC004]|uniref:HK97 family phage prohead protease n=1 Tax=Ensifer sp. PDNC004 TaxID=2811423 RepID=UPI0019649B01|nr:HK97 family phage prohead protease [Ensifer sp. PDNC004]QRY66544.1 HK97 family phage prohead protease [Ensifer sp. PDNC004]